MRYYRITLLSILVIPLEGLATISPWDDIHTKHSWNAVPSKWESLGCPPAGTTMDLHVSLKPHRESALIDVHHEVSDSMHPKHVHSTIPSQTHVLMYAAVPE
jgi:hypothetical protein